MNERMVVGAGRLTSEHVRRRDDALAGMARAAGLLDALAEIESDRSPRIAAVREIAGELRHLRTRLDGVYR